MVWRAVAGRTIEVDIDGGTSTVAVLGDVVVPVSPGQTIVLRHAGASESGSESPITHAFVGPLGDPPPLFAQQAGGLIPTPAVWGPCRTTETGEVVGVCPVPTGDAVDAWDGRSYWATGAMLPSETREIPLADDIPDGDHVFTCALHPGLRVVLRVGGEGSKSPDVASAVEKAGFVLEEEASGDAVKVMAGVGLDEAFVAAFSPRIVRIPVGGTVTWRAEARAPVDIVFGVAGRDALSLPRTVPTDGLPAGNADAWDGSGELRSGFLSADPSTGAPAKTWRVTFTKPGTYRYASRFGSGMTGTVIVEKDGA